MTRKKMRPALGGAASLGNVFIAANSPDYSKPLAQRQAEFLASRFGLPPSLAAVVADLAFRTEARQ